MPIRNRTGKKRDKMRSSSTSPARLTETREFETIPLQRRVKQGLGFRRSASASVLAATAIIAATETRAVSTSNPSSDWGACNLRLPSALGAHRADVGDQR